MVYRAGSTGSAWTLLLCVLPKSRNHLPENSCCATSSSPRCCNSEAVYLPNCWPGIGRAHPFCSTKRWSLCSPRQRGEHVCLPHSQDSRLKRLQWHGPRVDFCQRSYNVSVKERQLSWHDPCEKELTMVLPQRDSGAFRVPVVVPMIC